MPQRANRTVSSPVREPASTLQAHIKAASSPRSLVAFSALSVIVGVREVAQAALARLRERRQHTSSVKIPNAPGTEEGFVP